MHEEPASAGARPKIEAVGRIQRVARAYRVRRAARILSKLPTDLKLLTVQMARSQSLQRDALYCGGVVARIVMARMRRCGVSLGNALVASKSWHTASLQHHFGELCDAYTLATSHHSTLPRHVVRDMLQTVSFYEERCSCDASNELKRSHAAMRAFACAVLDRRCQETGQLLAAACRQ